MAVSEVRSWRSGQRGIFAIILAVSLLTSVGFIEKADLPVNDRRQRHRSCD